MYKNLLCLVDENEDSFYNQVIVETSMERADFQEMVQQVKNSIEDYTMDDVIEELIQRGIDFEIRSHGVIIF